MIDSSTRLLTALSHLSLLVQPKALRVRDESERTCVYFCLPLVAPCALYLIEYICRQVPYIPLEFASYGFVCPDHPTNYKA